MLRAAMRLLLALGGAAVAALLRDASERRRLADAARTLVETRYGWEVPVAALDALYTKIAGGSCGSSGS